MKKTLLISALFLTVALYSQERFYTRNGHIDFFSHAPLEDIEANNDQVAAFLETNTGEFTFGVLMKSFDFEKALMQEHFNENYLESDEFPRALFNGIIVSNSKVDYSSPGTYKVTVKGTLTIHGISKEVLANGELVVQEKQIIATSSFKVKPKDYAIKIPSSVKNNIAEVIDVNVKVQLKPYKD